MGYGIGQVAAKFRMLAKHKPKALEAIKGLAGQETIHDSSGWHFSWVETKDFLAATSLEEAMLHWRWKLDVNKSGDVTGIHFDGEKSGDDEYLFKAIAPYVAPGSYIDMLGEDGARWRWWFDGKSVQRLAGYVRYQMPRSDR